MIHQSNQQLFDRLGVGVPNLPAPPQPGMAVLASSGGTQLVMPPPGGVIPPSPTALRVVQPQPQPQPAPVAQPEPTLPPAPPGYMYVKAQPPALPPVAAPDPLAELLGHAPPPVDPTGLGLGTRTPGEIAAAVSNNTIHYREIGLGLVVGEPSNDAETAAAAMIDEALDARTLSNAAEASVTASLYEHDLSRLDQAPMTEVVVEQARPDVAGLVGAAIAGMLAPGDPNAAAGVAKVLGAVVGAFNPGLLPQPARTVEVDTVAPEVRQVLNMLRQQGRPATDAAPMFTPSALPANAVGSAGVAGWFESHQRQAHSQALAAAQAQAQADQAVVAHVDGMLR